MSPTSIRSLLVPLAFSLPLLVPTGPASGERVDLVDSHWEIAGKGKVRIKRVGKFADTRTLDVTFTSENELRATQGFLNVFEGRYERSGKDDKKITVLLDEMEITASEGFLESIGGEILTDQGIGGQPDVTITKDKIRAKLAKNGTKLKVQMKFKFIATVLGLSRKGKFKARLKSGDE